MGPVSIHGGSTGHPPTHRCSQSLAGWHGHCPLSLGMAKCQAGPNRRPRLWILFFHLLGGCGDLWDQLPIFVLFPFVESSWSHPWGRMGVGGGRRQLGFFSWWVVGLEQSRASQPSPPQPPPPLVHGWDISSSSDLIWSQCDDCLLLCTATGPHWSQI